MFRGIVLEEAIDAALEELPDDLLIKPFLLANKAEVKRMCITEYDEARTFAEQREKGREEERNTIIDNMRKAGFTEEQIRLALGDAYNG